MIKKRYEDNNLKPHQHLTKFYVSVTTIYDKGICENMEPYTTGEQLLDSSWQTNTLHQILMFWYRK